MTGQPLLQQAVSGYQVKASFSDGAKFVGQLTSLPDGDPEKSVEALVDALVASANANELDVDVSISSL